MMLYILTHALNGSALNRREKMATYTVTATTLSQQGGWPAGRSSTLCSAVECADKQAALAYVAEALDFGSVEEMLADYADTYRGTRSAQSVVATAI